MDGGFRIGTIRGIELRVNWSVLAIVVLVTWSLAEQQLPELEAGAERLAYWGAALVLALSLLASLVAHELGHSVVAQREGVGVRSVTLWLFGGVAQLEGPAPTPRAAMRIAGAGPAVSAALGVTALAIGIAVPGLAGASIGWLGVINLVLAVFNLLPAFPMDGGRLYQAWLWARHGDRHAATRRAAATGRTIGAGLIALGVAEALVFGALGGLWLAFIGWFVREAARSESTMATLEGPLARLTTADVMSVYPETVAATTTVEEFVTARVLGGRHTGYPVVGDTGEVVGLVTLRQVQARPRATWTTTTVGDVATPLAQVPVLEPRTSVADLLAAFGAARDTRALVMDQGALVGIVAPTDVARLLSAVELAGEQAQIRSK